MRVFFCREDHKAYLKLVREIRCVSPELAREIRCVSPELARRPQGLSQARQRDKVCVPRISRISPPNEPAPQTRGPVMVLPIRISLVSGF